MITLPKFHSFQRYDFLHDIVILAPEHLTSETIDCICRFRAKVYGNLPAVAHDRRHYCEQDDHSYHILVFKQHQLVGTARYTRCDGAVHLGGFTVTPEMQKTRVAAMLIEAVQNLAISLGDTVGMATASVRTKSAQILKKLGGKVVSQYYEPLYDSVAEVIRFEFRHVEDIKSRK